MSDDDIDMNDIDALLDDEDELFLDDEEEDMAFLAEQDDDDEDDDDHHHNNNVNDPSIIGTQDLDWLENESDMLTQVNDNKNLNNNKRSSDDVIEVDDEKDKIDDDAQKKKRMATNIAGSALNQEDLAKQLKAEAKKKADIEKKEREIELEHLRYKSIARNDPPLLSSAECAVGQKFISVTDPNDITKRVYLKIEEYSLGECEEEHNNNNNTNKLLSDNQLAKKKGKHTYDQARAAVSRIHLLNEPIDDMLKEIEARRYALAVEAAAKMDSELNGGDDEEMPTSEEVERVLLGNDASADAVETERRKKKIKEIKLKIANSSWLAKYSPRRFVDLLSEERGNRELLSWLKSWDKIVFNKNTPNQMTHQMINPSVMSNNNDTSKNKNYNGEETFDASGRPFKKLALISGSPGVGKTTLAHIAAKHCGYRVVEINAASTQKSSEGLVKAVKQAVEMRSVLESMKGFSVSNSAKSLPSSNSEKAKPNCLIIDEIDAMFGGNEGRGAMSALLKIVNGSWGKKNNHNNSNGPLNRPIILICNDQYSAALRQLRDSSKLIRLRVPASARVTHRLREICAKEKISADPRAISQLAETCEMDIRACLNHLQYKSLARGRFSMADAPVPGESKDIGSKSLEIMRDMYRGRHTFMEKTYPGQEKHFSWMYDRFQTFGDDNFLLESTFENLPNARLSDQTMQLYALASQDLSNADIFNSSKGANSSDYFYGQLCSVHHRASSSSSMETMQFPKLKAVERELQRKREITREWIEKAKSDSRSISSNGTNPQIDVLPYLMTIIAPDVGRAAGYDFMSKKEGDELKRAVDVTRSTGLTYTNAPLSASSYSRRTFGAGFQLQPSVDELIKYGGGVYGTESKPLSATGATIRLSREEWLAKRNALNEENEKLRNEKLIDRRELGPNARELVAREVAMDEIRQRARNFDPESSFTPEKDGEKKIFTNQNVVNLPQSAAYDEMKKAGNARLEIGFSGGNKHKMAASNKPKVATGGTKYKYNEGFTNALRRTVYMKDLFPGMVRGEEDNNK